MKKNSGLMEFAMLYGLFLAIYFIIKFVISILAVKASFLTFTSLILLGGIPFVIFKMLKLYRDRYCDGIISFNATWNACVLLVLFASLPEALSQYIYLEYINPNFITEQLNQVTEVLGSFEELKSNQKFMTFMDQYKSAPAIKPISMVMQVIFNNIFFATILGLILGLCITKDARKVQI